MKLTVEKKQNYTVLALGEKNLNSTLAPGLKSEFIIKRNEGVKNLILDLSSVTFVDSSGLSAILTAHRLWGMGDGQFILTGLVNENVEKLIKISRLDSVFSITENVEDAIARIEVDELEQKLNSDKEE